MDLLFCLTNPIEYEPTYPGFGNVLSDECRVNGINTPCKIVQTLMRAGALATQSMIFNGKWKNKEHEIIPLGVGLYRRWVNDDRAQRHDTDHDDVLVFNVNDDSLGHWELAHAGNPQDSLRTLSRGEVSSQVNNILKLFKDNPDCEIWTNELLKKLTTSTGIGAGNIRDILEAFKRSGIIYDAGKNGDGGGEAGPRSINLTSSDNKNPAVAERNTALALLHEIIHWAGFRFAGGKYVSYYTDAAMASAWNKLRVVISVSEFKDRYSDWIKSEIKAGRSPYIESRLAGAANKITCLGARPGVRTLK